LPVGAQEAFLHDIFRVLFITSHTKGQAEHGAAMPFDEHTKGVLVAFARLFGGR